MGGMSRRQILRGSAVLAVASPFLVAQTLARKPPRELPKAETGQLMTAETWNALVDRVSELGRQS